MVRNKIVIVGCLCALAAGAAAPAQGAVTVVDVAQEAGMAETTRTYSAAVADYNADGYEDALIVRHNPQAWPDFPLPRLWANNGDGTFTDQGSFFTPSDRHGCAWGDANGDGRLDLACGVGFGPESRNELWIQQLDNTFVDESQDYGVADPDFGGRGRMAAFLKADGDVYPDLYFNRYASCQEIDGTCVQEDPPKPNRAYRNEGLLLDRHYVDAPEFGLDQAIQAHKDTAGCAQAIDYDGDLDEDLLVCGRYAVALYRHDAGDTFVKLGLGKGWKDAQIADLNGTGRPDLVQVKGDRVQIRMATATGFAKGTQWTFAGGGENVAVGDFDGDLRNDVYVLRNCTPETGPDLADFLLMNGSGSFTKQNLAPVSQGCGNTVERIDYDDDGSDEFLVLNGRKKRAGPVQLLKSG